MEEHSECGDFTSLHYWLIPAVIFTIFASFSQKHQTNEHVDHNTPLFKRLCLPLPLRMLSTHRGRWSVAMASGAMVNMVLDRIMRGSCLLFQVPFWATVVVQILSTLEVTLVHYPIFICLTQENSILGNLMGFCYTLAWFVYQVMSPDNNQTNEVPWYESQQAMSLPSLFCTAYLVLCFLFTFFKLSPMRQQRQPQMEDEEPLVSGHNIQYVKRLLYSKSSIGEKHWFQRWVYEWDPCFRFPARMLIMAVVAFIGVYTFPVTMLVMFHSSTLLGRYGPGFSRETAAICMTAMIMVYHIVQIMVQYRTQVQRLYRGDRTGLPKTLPPSDVALTWSISYIGRQFISIYLSMILLCIVLTAGICLFDSCIIIPLRQELVGEVFQLLGTVLANIIPLLLISFMLRVISQRFFLQDKLSPLDKEKPLALNNIRSLENVTYFSLFYFMIVGVIHSLFSLLSSIILGILTLARHDQPAPLSRLRGFLSSGHLAWMSVLLVDSVHTNPTALTFCHLLLRFSLTFDPSTDITSHSGTRMVGRDRIHRGKARRRWWLCYTLLRNPSMVDLRRCGRVLYATPTEDPTLKESITPPAMTALLQP